MSRTGDRSILVRNVAIGVTILVAALAALYLWYGGREAPTTELPAALQRNDAVPDEPDTRAQTGADADRPGDDEDLVRRWRDAVGQAPAWPEDLSSSFDCAAVELELARACAAVDARVGSSGLATEGGARALLERVVGDLAAAPPDLSSELRSYEAMLSNVFHVFRVLGRERVQVLRDALGQEQDLAEPLALAFYRWSISRGSCAKDGPSPIRPQTLYAYAGFLFHTMGGQAYLRRRAPKTEALVCFYALQALDQAIAGGYNPQGLDPRGEIPRCQALVATQPLVFSDRYVDELDRMSRAWESRASGNP